MLNSGFLIETFSLSCSDSLIWSRNSIQFLDRTKAVTWFLLWIWSRNLIHNNWEISHWFRIQSLNRVKIFFRIWSDTPTLILTSKTKFKRNEGEDFSTDFIDHLGVHYRLKMIWKILKHEYINFLTLTRIELRTLRILATQAF